jgi:hypothetical protein
MKFSLAVRITTLFIALFMLKTPAACADVADPELAQQILLMAKEDRQVRSEGALLPADLEKYRLVMREVEQRHQLAIRKIFAERGWPSEKA